MCIQRLLRNLLLINFLQFFVPQKEADAYMAMMDGFAEDNDEDSTPDGLITIEEWHEYFHMMAADDTDDATTSPGAAKALAALEYARVQFTASQKEKVAQKTQQEEEVQRATQPRFQINTSNFWVRVTALFKHVRSQHTTKQPNAQSISRNAVLRCFGQRTRESDWCVLSGCHPKLCASPNCAIYLRPGTCAV